jgi:hypothetical protein
MHGTHFSKTLAGVLALFLGWAGAHRLYLRSSWWWIYPAVAMPGLALAFGSGGDAWFRHPGFFVAVVPTLIAMLEAIFVSLTPDAKWDSQHNQASGKRSDNRWGPVLVAIVALMMGATLMMSVMAIALEALFMPSGR